jgi:hypothetical protein
MLLAPSAHRAFALNPLTRLQAETRPAGSRNAIRIADKPRRAPVGPVLLQQRPRSESRRGAKNGYSPRALGRPIFSLSRALCVSCRSDTLLIEWRDGGALGQPESPRLQQHVAARRCHSPGSGPVPAHQLAQRHQVQQDRQRDAKCRDHHRRIGAAHRAGEASLDQVQRDRGRDRNRE